MSNIVVASMVKDELGRFLPSALHAWAKFAHEIVILDDNSGDGSREFAEDFGARVVPRGGDDPLAWGNETPARRALFEAAWEFTRVGDYIFWLDADMVPARDPRPLVETEADGIFFRLYDLWSTSPLTYREDSFWRGHLFPRLWLLRKQDRPISSFRWSGRGIHSGHLPEGLDLVQMAYAPEDFSLLHYAYSEPDLREEKYAAYASVSTELTEFERSHAVSIMDESPRVLRLPFEPSITLERCLAPITS